MRGGSSESSGPEQLSLLEHPGGPGRSNRTARRDERARKREERLARTARRQHRLDRARRRVERPSRTPRRLIPTIHLPKPRLSRYDLYLSRRATVILSAVLVVGVGVWGLFAFRLGPTRVGPRSGPAIGTTNATLALSLVDGASVYQAVVAEPVGRPSVAIALPSQVEVDVPGGGPVVAGDAGASGPLLVEVTQAAFGRRMQHYVVMDTSRLSALVDRLGGIQVQVEAAFWWNGRVYGPGLVRLSGTAVASYLEAGSQDDRTARWEDVLAGMLAGPAQVSRWRGDLGQADDAAAAAAVLAAAHNATVLEVPTAPAADGGLGVDARKFAAQLRTNFGAAGGSLLRVIVLNGNGIPGIGAKIAALLAPAGYRVVASQNNTKFNVPETQVIASSSNLLRRTAQVQSLIGVGKVYVGPQPTGIADITIVVGKDFQLG